MALRIGRLAKDQAQERSTAGAAHCPE